MMVGESYVGGTLKRHHYLIFAARRELKHRVPRPIPCNRIWKNYWRCEPERPAGQADGTRPREGERAGHRGDGPVGARARRRTPGDMLDVWHIASRLRFLGVVAVQ